MTIVARRRTLACIAMLFGLTGCASSSFVSGLDPIHPPMPMLLVPKVDSLQPTLSWEPFPGGYDRKSDPDGSLDSVTDVTYELKIWSAELFYGETHAADIVPPADGTYVQTRLLDAQHTVGKSLQPDTAYFWTVRARFNLDGDPAINTWAGWHPAGVRKTRENWRPHRFRTPKESNLFRPSQ